MAAARLRSGAGRARRCGAVTVTVLQMGHALGDGVRSSALAAVLFGRAANVPGLEWRRRGCLIARGVAAARAHRRLEHDTAAGLVPRPAPLRPALSINGNPTAGARSALVRRRSELSGPTVTVAVLAAISGALSAYLRDRDEDPSTLGAEVPMAKHLCGKPTTTSATSVSGCTRCCRSTRGRRIAAELSERRRRAEHPAFAAGDGHWQRSQRRCCVGV